MAECNVDAVINNNPEADKTDSPGMLTLHVVEVSAEQEPALLEEEEEKPVESEETKGEESWSNSSLGESSSEIVEGSLDKTREEHLPKTKSVTLGDTTCKDMEIDEWLFEFAQLFRTHVGIDPDAHVNLHELGMELYTEAFEETETSEGAQSLFDKAACRRPPVERPALSIPTIPRSLAERPYARVALRPLSLPSPPHEDWTLRRRGDGRWIERKGGPRANINRVGDNF